MTPTTSEAQPKCQPGERIHEVNDCPRCGTDHGEQVFRRLVRPMRAAGGAFEWWWTCTTTREPVIAELPPEEDA